MSTTFTVTDPYNNQKVKCPRSNTGVSIPLCGNVIGASWCKGGSGKDTNETYCHSSCRRVGDILNCSQIEVDPELSANQCNCCGVNTPGELSEVPQLLSLIHISEPTRHA